MALTPKQQRFVEEYLVDLNATQAAIRAGYSSRNPDKIGPELLGKTRIAEAIQAERDRRSRRVELTQDQVIQGLLTEAKLTGEGSSHSARVTAWTQLGKHLGMFVDRHEVTQSVRLEIVEEIVDGDHSKNGEAPSEAAGVPPV